MSPTGKGLNIVISCEQKPAHSWMTFAAWYSIYKNLPDAQVGVFCKRTDKVSNLFEWKTKCKVPFFHYSDQFKAPPDALVITPEVMAVDVYNKDRVGPIPAKSDDPATFVSYLDGCGSFVLSEWINTSRNPLANATKFYSNTLSLNEYRVLKLWEKCHKVYVAIV